MHIHILGIAGTFMAGLAVLAKQLGHRVTGTDHAIYPPMSNLLQQEQIPVLLGYDSHQFEDTPDLILVGNAMSRGNPLVEILLNKQLPFMSGPQWLYQEILAKKWVLAVSGTHGKTTTSSMVAWILESAGLNPSFLIGGKPGNFAHSARLTDSPYFVIEADEYDTAFFDKRAKFVHYHPRTLVINNLEFDHADIYPDLASIQQQFHHLIRTVAAEGCILFPDNCQAITETMARGCWSGQETIGQSDAAKWSYQLIKKDGSEFTVYCDKQVVATVQWPLWGEHNVSNAVTAIAASSKVGVSAEVAAEALSSFISSARRMERKAKVAGITVYEDFAHHPTAIATTLAGFRAHYPKQRLLCVLELRSYTMKQGYHQDTLPESLRDANEIFILQPDDISWSVDSLVNAMPGRAQVFKNVAELTAGIVHHSVNDDVIILMSNGSFGGLQESLPKALAAKSAVTAQDQ